MTTTWHRLPAVLLLGAALIAWPTGVPPANAERPAEWPRPSVHELPPSALASWRTVPADRPALVLLSNDPWLGGIPSELAERALSLARDGTPDALQAHGRRNVSDPLLLPTQTVTAAISSGFFSQVIWVAPLPPGGLQPDIEVFRRQLVGEGILTQEEADGFSTTSAAMAGTLRGVEARFLFALDQLDALDLREPVIHFDLSYFLARYQDEVRTPVYELLRSTVASLRGAMRPRAVSVSLSTWEGDVPLDFRFVGRDLATVLEDLSVLGRPLPREWLSRAKALYMANLLKGDEVLSGYQGLAKSHPEDSSVHFALYGLHRARNRVDLALASLATAAKLDPAYGYEYWLLADIAAQQGRLGSEVEMLDLAAKYDRENPFLLLRKAQAVLGTAGEQTSAAHLIKELRKLTWSSVYYPELPGLLEELAARASSDATAP